MRIIFYKTDELFRWSYLKVPLKTSTLLEIISADKNCFFWLILAHLHPCEINHPNRVSVYRQCFNKFYIQGFDFTNGFK